MYINIGLVVNKIKNIRKNKEFNNLLSKKNQF